MSTVAIIGASLELLGLGAYLGARAGALSYVRWQNVKLIAQYVDYRRLRSRVYQSW